MMLDYVELGEGLSSPPNNDFPNLSAVPMKRKVGDWWMYAEDLLGPPVKSWSMLMEYAFHPTHEVQVLGLAAMGWRSPSLLAAVAVHAQVPDVDRGLPMWFVQARDQLLRLRDEGKSVADMMRSLQSLANAREQGAYTDYVDRALNSFAPAEERAVDGDMVIVLDEACQKWVLYVERHLFHEFVEAQCLDLSAQEEPLLQRQIVQGLTGDRTLSHVRFHRDEWIGAGVQFHHDCFWAGFCTRGLVAQTRQHIQERRERSFAVLAGPYLDCISSQVADFAGSPDAPPPPGAEEWARGMSNTLWLLYREEGLCSEMLDEADMEGQFSSSSDEDITGDEASMVQRDKPKRKWLADDGPSRRRRQPPPRPRDGGGAGDGGSDQGVQQGCKSQGNAGDGARSSRCEG